MEKAVFPVVSLKKELNSALTQTPFAVLFKAQKKRRSKPNQRHKSGTRSQNRVCDRWRFIIVHCVFSRGSEDILL